jgi:hypothetical protein
MKEWDPTGRNGPRTPLPDVVKVSRNQVDHRRLVSQMALAAVVSPCSYDSVWVAASDY